MWPEKILTQTRDHYSTLYIDMNSFFASVEQFYDPKLRGKPVGVCAGLSSGSTVLAASVEAKRLGIATGTKVAEARVTCPDIVLMNGNHKTYKAVHTEIMAILHQTRCYVGAKSIDEAFMLIPSYLRSREESLALAKQIKQALFGRYQEHIRASIGISSNIWLAKMASNAQKPDGLVCIALNQLEGFYSDLRLIDMTGVGRRMSQQFYRKGIYTPLQLYQATYRELQKYFGVVGSKWYLRMRGYEVDSDPPKPQKSLGHQVTTMPNPPGTVAEATTFCLKIATTLGYRLRNKRLKAKGILLHLRFTDHMSTGYMIKNLPTFNSDHDITRYIYMLLKKLKVIYPVKRISITLFDLTADYQLELPLQPEQSRFQRLSYASDLINNRFGKGSIQIARAMLASSVDLERVGFAGDQIRESYGPNVV